MIASRRRLLVAAALLISLYGLLPLLRHGLGTRTKDDIAGPAKSARIRLSTSDLVLMVSGSSVSVAPLTPRTARTLAAAGLSVRSLPDLPGILPILALGTGAAYVFAASRRRSLTVQAALHEVRRLLIAAGAIVLYVWYWAGAADHNVIHGQLLARPWTGSLIELFLWYVGILICLPFIIVGAWLMLRLIGARSESAVSLVCACYIALVGVVALMFPPEPYSRYVVLSWWPLFFGLSLIACAAVSRTCLQRALVSA